MRSFSFWSSSFFPLADEVGVDTSPIRTRPNTTSTEQTFFFVSFMDLPPLPFVFHMALKVVPILRRVSPIHHQNNHTPNHSQGPEDRRNRNYVVLFLGRLNWTYIHHLLVRRIRETLVGQREYSSNH